MRNCALIVFTLHCSIGTVVFMRSVHLSFPHIGIIIFLIVYVLDFHNYI
jgi:hypothetical protein